MKVRYRVPSAIIVAAAIIIAFASPISADLYEPLEESKLTPPSMEEFQQMAENRVENHACMKKAEKWIENQKLLKYQSWTEPTLNMYDYDVTHYEINIGLDFADAFISGYSKTTLTVLKDGLSMVDLNLGYIYGVSNVMLNDSINISFSKAQWYLLHTYLPEPFDSGAQISITVYYSGYPNQVGYMTFYNYGSSQVCFTSVEPYGSRFWWPCKDFPFDKPDSVDLIVTHPANHKLVSNGLQRSRVDNGDGTATTHWHEGYPIATYLVTIGCTDYGRFDQSWEYAPGQFLPIEQYYYPEAPPTNQSYSSYYFDLYTIPSLEALSYWHTLYPFIEERYGHNHYGWGGAMEHQTMTSISPNFNTEYVIAHEAAHQWGGDLVTCRNFHHIWLNEGFASYSEVLYFRYHYGEQYANTWLNYQKHLDAGTPYVEDLENDYIFDNVTVYDKASWLFYMLHMILGDEGFRNAMDTYFHDPDLEFASAVTDDLEAACETVYGDELDWFFDAWVYQEGNPVYQYSYQYEENTAGNYEITLAIDQIQEYNKFTMPIEVQAFMGAADTTITVFNNLRNQIFQFKLDSPPDSILIDPNDKILCEKVFEPEFTVHIIGQEMPEAYVGLPYYIEFEAVGGTPPYTWNKVSGQFPYGLTLSSNGDIAVLEGTPTFASTFSFFLEVEDNSVPTQSMTMNFVIDVNPPPPVCGDLNVDQEVNIADIIFMINYIYLGGESPETQEIADVNCDDKISLVDIIYLVNYIFRGGAEPCADCPL